MWKKYGWDHSGMLFLPPSLAPCYLEVAYPLGCCGSRSLAELSLADESWDGGLAQKAERNLKLLGW